MWCGPLQKEVSALRQGRECSCGGLGGRWREGKELLVFGVTGHCLTVHPLLNLGGPFVCGLLAHPPL